LFLPFDLPKRGKQPALEFWTLQPYQIPLGVPEGRHRIIYVSPTGDALGDAILAYYPITTPSAPARAVDASAPGDSDFLKLKQDEQKIAARAAAILLADAEVKKQAGQHANMQAMSQDLADAYRTVLDNATAIATQAVEVSKKLLEGYQGLMDAAASHAKRVGEAIPVPPPPPQDWAGVVKDGVNVLGDLAESWGLKRGNRGRIEESSKRIEIKESLPAGASKEPVDAETTDKPANKPADNGPDDSEPPSAPASAAKPAPPPSPAPKESRQETAKRVMHRVALACSSVTPQHAIRFLHDAPFLRRFLFHLRLMMFPVTSWRWRPA
jgi:hypothetical protein